MKETSFALYRKYRPDTFDEVRNQEHIVNVLKGAIKKNTIPHALLFTGSRGTGKTTVARIFAKAIGTDDVDLYEIDAASNRGIDDIRALNEAVHIHPFKSKYKVYIIDEVHMLTKEAFNALLKTLEEPPSYVIFILATTEQDKLLPTIISRCQLFTFRAPTRSELQATVEHIAKKEEYDISTESADIIALCADGSYRDALGILQKVMMASQDKCLSADEVALIVGAPKNILIQDVLKAFQEKDTAKGLHALEEASALHVDMKIFFRLLLERVRLIILLRNKIAFAKDMLEQYSGDEKALLMKCAESKGSPINSHLLLRMLATYDFLGHTSITQLPIELILLEIAEGNV